MDQNENFGNNPPPMFGYYENDQAHTIYDNSQEMYLQGKGNFQSPHHRNMGFPGPRYNGGGNMEKGRFDFMYTRKPKNKSNIYYENKNKFYDNKTVKFYLIS